MARTLLALSIGLLVGCNRQPAPPNASPSGAMDGGQPAAPSQPIGPTPAGAAVQIPVGAVVHGVLETGDRALSDESLGDDYAIMLTEGEPVTIVTRGGASEDGGVLDVQTLLLLNNHEVASDDDSAASGNALNSRIVFSPTVTGLYLLRVTTSGPGAKRGSYTMQVYRGGLLQQM